MLILKYIKHNHTGEPLPFKVEDQDGNDLDAYVDHTRDQVIIVNVKKEEK